MGDTEAADDAQSHGDVKDTQNRRRFGVIVVSHTVIAESPAAVRELMARVIVVRAESLYAQDVIEYVALCDEFAPLAFGETMPRYAPRFRKNEDGIVSFDGWE